MSLTPGAKLKKSRPAVVCAKTGMGVVSNSNHSNHHKQKPGDGTTNTDIIKAANINQKLKQENMNLRLRLQHVRMCKFSESTKLLDSLMAYCDARSKAKKNKKLMLNTAREFSPHSGGLCGGYTPSGWNKLRSMGLLHDNDIMANPTRTKPLDCGGQGSPSGTMHEREGDNSGHFGYQSSKANTSAPAAIGSTNMRLDQRMSGEGNKDFRPSAKLLGEMCFQLERRVLDYVFGLSGSQRKRFYGYTVSNICYMINKTAEDPEGNSDVVSRTEMAFRLRKLTCALREYGYDMKVHADFSQEMINKYGLLPSPPDSETVSTFGLHDPCTVSSLISRLSKGQSEVHNLNIILNCLHFLSKQDGRPLFVW